MMDITLLKGLKTINGVLMMNSLLLANLCGNKNRYRLIKDTKHLYQIEKIKSTLVKGIFIELYEDGTNKGKIKEVWFDHITALAVANIYHFMYKIAVHDRFISLNTSKNITPTVIIVKSLKTPPVIIVESLNN